MFQSIPLLVQTFLFIALCHVVASQLVEQDFSDLPPGPYCSKSYDGCCPGRDDQCSHPIIGTICYCDEFCDRFRAADCCPDFFRTCRGISPPAPIGRCERNGIYFNQGEVIKENCNLCKCEVINNGTTVEPLCETNDCLVDETILATVNEANGWLANNYSMFWGRTLQDGLVFRLGTLQPHRATMRMNPVRRVYDPNRLPRSFDATEKWPRSFIRDIQDQGWCGSSWAISTAAVASDRFQIMSNGVESKPLSAQHLLSCNNRGQQSCKGGYLDRAWLFFRKYGVVDEECYPYLGSDAKCPYPRKGNLIRSGCQPPPETNRKEYYRVGPAYKLGNETDIMNEILKSGPVQATFKVYQDFFVYRSGVYRHSPLAPLHRSGYHSVRIVGWGEDTTNYPPVKYWRVANSWGRSWGEDGYFRIIRGINECEIESFVLGAWAKISDLSNNVLPAESRFG